MTDTFTIAIEGTEQGQRLLALAKQLRKQIEHGEIDPRLVAEMIHIIDGWPAPELPQKCKITPVTD